ncbi:MAG: hypothetical protein HY735_20265, partial [Verrucomicrobia bacterium]|nr:hypothetical protein [Verrucomicrobiota bacterium]
MKTKALPILLIWLLLVGGLTPALAQSPFTYQGRLTVGGVPATGTYDLNFQLFDAPTGGNAVGSPVTQSGVQVNNGLFTTVVDFGSNIFTGPGRWLEISVKASGTTDSFATLSGRQSLTPTPYAHFAHTAGNVVDGAITGSKLADNSVGSAKLQNGAITADKFPASLTLPQGVTVPTANLSGALLDSQLPSNLLRKDASGNLVLSGSVSASAFTGSGAGLSSLNAGSLMTGIVPDDRLSANVLRLTPGSQSLSLNAPGGVTINTLSAGNPVAIWTLDGAGNVSASGKITAGTFQGSGSQLTGLPANQLTGTLPSGFGVSVANLTSGTWPSAVFVPLGQLSVGSLPSSVSVPTGNLVGTIPNDRLGSNIPRLDTANNLLILGNVSAAGFSGSGANLTSLDPGSLSPGILADGVIVPDEALSANVLKLEPSIQSLSFNAPGGVTINTFSSGSPVAIWTLDSAGNVNASGKVSAATFHGSGAELTGLPANQLTGPLPTSFQLPAGQLTGSLPAGMSVPVGNLTSGTWPPSVVVPAANVTGNKTLPDSVLSDNIPKLNSTTTQTFSGDLTLGSSLAHATLTAATIRSNADDPSNAGQTRLTLLANTDISGELNVSGNTEVSGTLSANQLIGTSLSIGTGSISAGSITGTSLSVSGASLNVSGSVLNIAAPNATSGQHLSLDSSGNVIVVGGGVTANSFTGSGAGLTGLNPGNLISGSLPSVVTVPPANLSVGTLPSGVTLPATQVTDGNLDIGGGGITAGAIQSSGPISGNSLNLNAGPPLGPGGISASSLDLGSSGWIVAGAISAASLDVATGPIEGGSISLSDGGGNNRFSTATTQSGGIDLGTSVAIGKIGDSLTSLTVHGGVTASTFTGGGAGLTGLNPANLSSGTLAADVDVPVANLTSGTLPTAVFVPANQLTGTGNLPDAVIGGNIPRLGGGANNNNQDLSIGTGALATGPINSGAIASSGPISGTSLNLNASTTVPTGGISASSLDLGAGGTITAGSITGTSLDVGSGNISTTGNIFGAGLQIGTSGGEFHGNFTVKDLSNATLVTLATDGTISGRSLSLTDGGLNNRFSVAPEQSGEIVLGTRATIGNSGDSLTSLTVHGGVTASTFTGAGAGLTGLNPANLASGTLATGVTVPDGALSANVAKLDASSVLTVNATGGATIKTGADSLGNDFGLILGSNGGSVNLVSPFGINLNFLEAPGSLGPSASLSLGSSGFSLAGTESNGDPFGLSLGNGDRSLSVNAPGGVSFATMQNPDVGLQTLDVSLSLDGLFINGTDTSGNPFDLTLSDQGNGGALQLLAPGGITLDASGGNSLSLDSTGVTLSSGTDTSTITMDPNQIIIDASGSTLTLDGSGTTVSGGLMVNGTLKANSLDLTSEFSAGSIVSGAINIRDTSNLSDKIILGTDGTITAPTITSNVTDPIEPASNLLIIGSNASVSGSLRLTGNLTVNGTSIDAPSAAITAASLVTSGDITASGGLTVNGASISAPNATSLSAPNAAITAASLFASGQVTASGGLT